MVLRSNFPNRYCLSRDLVLRLRLSFGPRMSLPCVRIRIVYHIHPAALRGPTRAPEREISTFCSAGIIISLLLSRCWTPPNMYIFIVLYAHNRVFSLIPSPLSNDRHLVRSIETAARPNRVPRLAFLLPYRVQVVLPPAQLLSSTPSVHARLAGRGQIATTARTFVEGVSENRNEMYLARLVCAIQV